MLNGELYAQILQKLVYLHLPTDCFMKISLQSWHGGLKCNEFFSLLIAPLNTCICFWPSEVQIPYDYCLSGLRLWMMPKQHSHPVQFTSTIGTMTHLCTEMLTDVCMQNSRSRLTPESVCVRVHVCVCVVGVFFFWGGPLLHSTRLNSHLFKSGMLIYYT